jgi:hypothetical protein
MDKKVDRLALIGFEERGPVVVRKDGKTGEIDGPAVLVSAKEGHPIPEGTDYVMTKQTERVGIWDSVTVFSNRRGPPKVVSEEYRANYDRIFSGEDKGGDDGLLN